MKGICVISVDKFGEVHDIQTNSLWKGNPYGESYAIVPADMVEGIVATRGYCDIVLNEEGTEVVSFTAREIPELPEYEEPKSKVELLIETLYNAGRLTEEEYKALTEQGGE